MTRRHRLLGAVMIGVAAALVGLAGRGPQPSGPVAEAGTAPRLMPVLAGVVLPPNVAAPGLRIDEPGSAWHVRLRGAQGPELRASGRRPGLRLPARGWRRLLAANAGGQLTLTVSVRGAGGRWTRFAPLTLSVAREPIDRYLVYRLLTPGYNLAGDVGVYQRDLTGYRQRLVMHGRQVGGCCNCHTFWQGSGDRFTLGTRSDTMGGRTLLASGRDVVAFRQPVGYGSWHPNGKLVAYSVNKVAQFFHTAGEETRDVLDLSAGLTVLDAQQRRFATTPELTSPDYLYTYPCWSPDGRHLYFARARRPWGDFAPYPPKEYAQVRYDLARVPFDADTGAWGRVETLLSGQAAGRSFVFPRVSPDGRWLLYTSCDYGCFPIHRPSADLGLLDLRSGRTRPVSINSERADTWHTWSRDGRWIVFSSKRADGLFTRLYLSYFDTDGRLHPPLLLPQRRPDYYDTLWYSYNVPELIASPVRADPGHLGRAARAAQPIDTPPPCGASGPTAGPR